MMYFAFVQNVLRSKCRKCKFGAFTIIRILHNLNIVTVILITNLCALKNDEVSLMDKDWESLIAPCYFLMTELLFISIISFVVLVNALI